RLLYVGYMLAALSSSSSASSYPSSIWSLFSVWQFSAEFLGPTAATTLSFPPTGPPLFSPSPSFSLSSPPLIPSPRLPLAIDIHIYKSPPPPLFLPLLACVIVSVRLAQYYRF
ncbi:hypothetical protein BJV74DRAFT_814815, partial [Russula compacta]